MNTVQSRDGTTIAFDRVGQGPPLIVVGGAFSYRRWKGLLRLAELLADRFTVINYDRRGRGDSTDTPPYAVEREIEDLEALIGATDGPAFVWGMSSGGVLALRAAEAGLRVEKLAVYQPPFMLDKNGHVPPADFATRLDELTAAGSRGDAVKYFMTKGMGVPAFFVNLMRLAAPMWSRLKAVAHTLPYDYAVMGETVTGVPLPDEPSASITTPTLVIDGGKSPASLHKAADTLANVLPNARRRTLEGQSHNVSMKVLAPVLEEFFMNGREGRPALQAERR
jgi:pimeloyl-ACP methyl ester carboxylesterase